MIKKVLEMRYCVGVYKYSLFEWMVGVLGDWLLVKMLLNGETFNDYCFFFIYDKRCSPDEINILSYFYGMIQYLSNALSTSEDTSLTPI